MPPENPPGLNSAGLVSITTALKLETIFIHWRSNTEHIQKQEQSDMDEL
jgi:hypothetical protein